MSVFDPAEVNAHGPVGRVREVRSADSDHPWRTLRLLGWALHVEDGWLFVPLDPRKRRIAARATFAACLPAWTGGLNRTESRPMKAHTLASLATVEASTEQP
jgi:hypothetical protein